VSAARSASVARSVSVGRSASAARSRAEVVAPAALAAPVAARPVRQRNPRPIALAPVPMRARMTGAAAFAAATSGPACELTRAFGSQALRGTGQLPEAGRVAAQFVGPHEDKAEARRKRAAPRTPTTSRCRTCCTSSRSGRSHKRCASASARQAPQQALGRWPQRASSGLHRHRRRCISWARQRPASR